MSHADRTPGLSCMLRPAGTLLPEKRKVDSSILSLTTRSDQVILPSYLRQRRLWPHLAVARKCPPGTFRGTGYGRSLVHVGGTASVSRLDANYRRVPGHDERGS